MTPHQLSTAESQAIGREARTQVSRKSMATLPERTSGFDPVAVLESQSKTRVPNLVPIRYGRMSGSPFAFYRGAAAVMADDLALSETTGITTQICGDAHLANFGAFATPERAMAFDVNDFDETLPGPWEWDVKRFCASLVVAAQSNGFTTNQQEAIAARGARAYREALLSMGAMSALDVWYCKFDVEAFALKNAKTVPSAAKKRMKKNREKAATRNSAQAFSKLTEVVDGKPQFLDTPPLLVPLSKLLPEAEAAKATAMITASMNAYKRTLAPDRRFLLEQYRLVDIAHKVVGVGSVGTRAWVLLFMGHAGDDPLLLQVKQAEASVLEKHVGRSKVRNHGQRVVLGQKLMQAASDIFLGWTTVKGFDGRARDFYVRQLRDGKFSAQIELMEPETMGIYADICGWTLARAHARSGDRIALAAYLGSGTQFDKAMTAFSCAYAERNLDDFAKLKAAIESKRIPAEIA